VVIGELVPPDAIIDIVHEIENLKQSDALAAVGQLHDQTEFQAFKIGGVLSRIQLNKWYEPEYATLKEYVEQEHGFKYRTAMYWIDIYNALVESGISWQKVQHIGWSKLKEIAKVLTAENVDNWVKTAEQQTVMQLQKTVADFVGGDEKALTESAPSVVSRTFKLHTDQKETVEAAIKKAKEMAETKVDTVALEFICLDFLGGQGGKSKGLLDLLSDAGLEASLEAFEKAFPDANLTVEVENEGGA
jgi:uncharacterized protein YdaT